jgi:CRISPR/Cas system CSM-associated protein Csm3 (group 7 of RAMP superfamily)
MAGRQEYNSITKYAVTAVCEQPMHIGSALGEAETVLVHPVDDIPFVQATGLAGVFRSASLRRNGKEDTDILFGSGTEQSGSKVYFSDGIFEGKKFVLELRPHVAIDRESQSARAVERKGSNQSAGQKFESEYIGAGARFSFSIYLYGDEKREELEAVLADVHTGNVAFGGRKSSGCGAIHFEKLRRKIFDMTDKEDRKLWADEDTLPESAYKDILSGLPDGVDAADAYEIVVEGKTEGAIMVRSIAVSEFGKDAPDTENIKNAKKEYIVPGSSIRGTIKSQMERIAAYLGCEPVIVESFGSQKLAGNLWFYDAVIGDEEEQRAAEKSLSHRIHIDKFTGGVMHGGKFSERNAHGHLSLKIVIRDQNEPDATCGLLLFALRDLAIQMMSLGGGYNVGKGMILVDRIRVIDCKNSKKAVLSISSESENQIQDEQGLIATCMAAVSKRRD